MKLLILLFPLFFLSTPPQKQYKYEYIADGFDYPVGKPDGEGYYNAQAFGTNNHLGDDFNATTGGDSDLGDPVYAVANGVVRFADNVGGGWGNVIRVVHQLPNETFVESLYAHCDTILVTTDTWVKKGDQIGTIGTAGGIYPAHLHFEIRDNIKMLIGGGYSKNQEGYLDPTAFIEANREF